MTNKKTNKQINKQIKVAIHNGTFHADEVYAIAILNNIYKKVEVIRTRDEKILEECDFRVDVGKKYNHETRDYDHHQIEFIEKRNNDIPYAACGLIWKHYGNYLVNTKEAFNYIDERIIQGVDAQDNGYDLVKSDINIYSVTEFISLLNPFYDEKESQDEAYFKALDFATKHISRLIKKANSLKEIEEKILLLNKDNKKEYLVLEEFIPWKNTIIKQTNLKLVIYQSSVGNWNIQAVNISNKTFDTRIKFPQKWCDMTIEELRKETNVEDSVFCHKAGFLYIVETKESAIKIAEILLNNYN